MNYFILDGWDITAEEGIYLIDSGQERSNKPRYESEQSYGANGNVNIFEEAFETYSRTFKSSCGHALITLFMLILKTQCQSKG